MGFLDTLFAEIGAAARPALFNVYFTALSLPIGFVLAVGLALLRGARLPVLPKVAAAYIYAFRGSPLFIQFFVVYSFMLSLNLTVWRPAGLDWLVLHPLFLGPLVLTLNTAAYTAEILYGAMRTVPAGEIEAAKAFGMSPMRRFRSVAWPNMLRSAWPAYTNEAVFLFHATALVYFTLPVVNRQTDLLRNASDLTDRDYNPFLHYGVAALYYLAISVVIFILFGLVYRRLMRHAPPDRPRRIRFAPKYLR